MLKYNAIQDSNLRKTLKTRLNSGKLYFGGINTWNNSSIITKKIFYKEIQTWGYSFFVWYDKSISKTTNKFKIDRNQIRFWVKREEQIQLQKRK